MHTKLTAISVIIVAYKHAAKLNKTLLSVTKQESSPAFEIIVVDNSRSKKIEQLVTRKYPQAMYLQPSKNVGYGGGNNYGVTFAKGKYLFFLNPDTELAPNVFEVLARFLDSHPQVGIVAPTLTNMRGQINQRQGATAILDPINALATSSLFHRVWPTNPIAQQHWQLNRDYTKDRQLAAVPGSAMMIRAQVFRQVGRFDERYFLYFEEDDLCKRVLSEGWEVWQLAAPKVKHHHGATTSTIAGQIFAKSRYAYFQKHYGKVTALLVEFLMRVGKTQIIFLSVIVVILMVLVIINTV